MSHEPPPPSPGDEPRPFIQAIFEDVDGRPVPRLPRNRDDSIRVPDGARFLSLDQTAERFGIPPSVLRDEYLSAWSDLLLAADVAAIEGTLAPAPLTPRRFPRQKESPMHFVRFGDLLINLDQIVTVELDLTDGDVAMHSTITDDLQRGRSGPRLPGRRGRGRGARYFKGDDFPDLIQGGD